jgi:hypothetical protein
MNAARAKADIVDAGPQQRRVPSEVGGHENS